MRIRRERDRMGPFRTDIELVDMHGEHPGPVAWYYRGIVRGTGPERPEPNLCDGYIAMECRGKPAVHTMKHLSHREFEEVAGYVC